MNYTKKQFISFCFTSILIVSLFVFITPLTFADTGSANIVSYQGHLADSGGNALGGAGTTYYFKFSLWDNATVGQGTKVWPTASPQSTSLNVKQGVFNVNIGDTVNGYPDTLDYNWNTNKSVYLQVEISSDNSNFETLTPRSLITSTPFAQVSNQVNGSAQSSFGTSTPFLNTVISALSTGVNSVVMSIKGIAGQVANLFNISDSNGNSLFSVGPTGAVSASSSLTVYGPVSFYNTLNAGTSTISNLTATNLIATTLTATTSTFINLTLGSSSSLSSLLGTGLLNFSGALTVSTSTIRNYFSSSATGLLYSSSSGIFSLASGYNIPLTASTTNWDSFYNTPSSKITAGTNLSWSGNTLNGLSTSTIQGFFSTLGSGLSYSQSTGAFTNTGVTAIGGTANQVNVSGMTGTVTLSLPQNIDTGASPTFASTTLSNFTAGSIPFFGTGGVLNQKNSQLFWDNTNSRLGIGTSSPGSKLDILDTTLAGSGSLAGSILNLAQTWNTTGTPTALKLNVTDTASNASSLLTDLQVGGVSKFSVKKNGSVYLGDSSGATSSNLYVGGSGVSAYGNIYFGDNNLLVGYGSGFGTQPLKVLANGGLQIGSFVAKLIGEGVDNVIAQRNGVSGQVFRLYNTYTDASNYERAGLNWSGNILSIGTENGGTGSARNLAFMTGNTTRMTIDTSGNVGISTTTPLAKLDLYGSSGSSADLFAVSSSTNLRLFTITAGGVVNATNDVTTTGRFVAGGDLVGANVYAQNFRSTISNPTFGINGSNYLQVTSNSYLFPSGNVGIGSSTPSTKLVVTGGAYIGGTITAIGGSIGLGTTTPSAQLHTTGTVRFGALTGAGSNLIVDSLGNVTVSSDERLKNIDSQFTRGLSDINKINPITFHWKASTGYDTTNAYTGFSAQNVQLAIPEAVATSSNGFLSLADRPIIAALVNAVKELDLKIERIIAWFSGDGGTFNVVGDVCVDNVCVTKNQFKLLLQNAGGTAGTAGAGAQASSSLQAENNNQAPVAPEVESSSTNSDTTVSAPVASTTTETEGVVVTPPSSSTSPSPVSAPSTPAVSSDSAPSEAPAVPAVQADPYVPPVTN